jgi:hypothetical protein
MGPQIKLLLYLYTCTGCAIGGTECRAACLPALRDDYTWMGVPWVFGERAHCGRCRCVVLPARAFAVDQGLVRAQS